MTLLSGVLRRRAPAVLAAGVLVVGTAAALAPPTALAQEPTKPQVSTPKPEQVPLRGVPAGEHTLTLVTGDKVTVTSDQIGNYTVRTQPATRPDASHPSITQQSEGSGTYVFPADVWWDVQSGLLDRELFNVSYLVENGYTDEQTASLPVIVQYPAARARTATALRATADTLPASTPTATLESIGGAGLTVAKNQAGQFWQAIRGTAGTAPGGVGARATSAPALGGGLAKVWLDRKVHVNLAESVPLIGAPQAWAAGHDGTGVKVAILDTGIDDTHPDLAGRVVESKSFVPGVDSVRDGHGHGTHVASTVAGSGAASDGKYRGVAPGAQLVIGKVLSDGGSGATAWAIEGMEWAAHSGAKVVSMSFGVCCTDGTDPASQAVNQLTAETGTLFVIAAGNNGPGTSTIGSPGAAESALTVAATDKSDGLADFSSRGPLSPQGGLKPDIAAPGVNIVAARAAGTSMAGAVNVGDHYTTVSGTSMATPHVAGAAAILAQQYPEWTPVQLKAALMSTSKDVGHTAHEQGAGRLDVARADRQQVLATTPSLDFGKADEDTPTQTRQISYTNLSDQDVTLTLTSNLRDSGTGAAADSALHADGTLTVPAGGSATATVTLDASGLALGDYGGAVVATADDVTLRTPVGVTRSPREVTLTIRAIGYDGKPVPGTPINHLLLLHIADINGRYTPRGAIEQVDEGVFQLRVTEDTTYQVSGTYEWIDTDYRMNWAGLIKPELTVHGDTEITLDQRDTVPFQVDTPLPSAQSQIDNNIQVVWKRTGTNGAHFYNTTGMAAFYRTWMLPSADTSKGEFVVDTQFTLVKPAVTMDIRSPRSAPLALHPMEWPHRDDPEWPRFDGSHVSALVDGGAGRPEDLAGKNLRGRLVLLDDDITDGNNCGISSRVLDRVHAAGALGAVVWPAGERGSCNVRPAVPLDLVRFDGATRPALPTVSVPPAEGRALRALLARRPVTLNLTGTPHSPYVYSVNLIEQKRVPKSLHYRFRDRDFAKVDLAFHAEEPTRFSFNGLVQLGDFLANDLTVAPTATGPDVVHQFVGPVRPGLVRQTIVTPMDGAGAGNPVFQHMVVDRPFRTTLHINAGPAVPAATPMSRGLLDIPMPEGQPFTEVSFRAICAMCRQGDALWPVVSPVQSGFTGGPGITGQVFVDGEQVPVSPATGVALPTGPATVRAVWNDPAHTSAEWTFRTEGTTTADNTPPGVYCLGTHPSFGGSHKPCRAEPAVFVGYDLGDTLALDNSTPAGRKHTFGVDVYHSPTTGSMPAIAGLKLWTSTDDGATWVPAQVRGGRDGQYTVTARYPRFGDTTGAVSLKVEAWDAAGNRVSMTTNRGFALRDTARPHNAV